MTTITDSPAHLRPLSRLGVLVMLTAPFLAGLDFFITNVALPTIERSLGASAGSLALIVAGYGIAYAVFLVLGGRLGDEYGRRRLFVIGLASFVLASLLAGLAPTLPILIAARVAQGTASALMTPQTLATFQSTLAGTARGRAIASYAAAGGLAAAVGQLLGGILVSAFGWRSIFLVNVPVGLCALLLVRFCVPASRSQARVGVDAVGTVLLGCSLALLLIPLTEGPAAGWPWWTFASLGAFVGLAAVFVRWSLTAASRGVTPLLPLSLVLGAPSMRRGLPVLVVFFAVFGAFMFVFALVAQDGLGLSSLAAGLAITPVCVAYFITSFRVPRLVERFGKRVLIAGLVLEGVGFAGAVAVVVAWWSVLGGALARSWAPVALVVIALIIVGIGQALGVGALFRLVLSQVPVSSAGVGGGVLVTTQQGALALGVAALGSGFAALAAGPGVVTGTLVVGGILVVVTLTLSIAARVLPSDEA
ncbi:MFS transporter [Parafrigoribacterium soli]|uniref:MFS transporter n=1 Tax=Parafrigoribacterium soli TaxID=3144663 RepID=UPI0032EC8261